MAKSLGMTPGSFASIRNVTEIVITYRMDAEYQNDLRRIRTV